MSEPRTAVPEGEVLVGRVSGLYGVRGWVRVWSETEPRENILRYRPWHLVGDGWQRRLEPAEGRRHGKGIVARLAGIEDRDAAAGLMGAGIFVARRDFAPADDGEFYWADLVGLAVTTAHGEQLGRVTGLIETGANDVLVVQGETRQLLPFVMDRVIRNVDLAAGEIVVDWEAGWAGEDEAAADAPRED